MGLEYLQQRRWMMQLCLLYKFLSTGLLSHIHNLLPQMRNSHRQPSTFHIFPCRTKYFKNSFFTNVISEYNKVDPNICSPSIYHIFCNALLKFIRPIYKNIFDIEAANQTFSQEKVFWQYPVFCKFTEEHPCRRRLGFSHLTEHKFRHGFKDILNPLSTAETTIHYSLRCYI